MSYWDDIYKRAAVPHHIAAPTRPGERRQGNGSYGQNTRRPPRPNSNVRSGYTRDSYYAEVRPDLLGGAQAGTTNGLADVDMRYASDEDLEAYVRDNYGFMGGFLDIPEVRSVLLNAARNKWEPGKIQGALYNTAWWKNTNASQREWARLLSEDPASARQQLQAQSAIVNDRAKSLGIHLSPAQINNMASMIQQNGWTTEQYIDNLIAQVDWSSIQGGELTANVDHIKEIAGQYLISISDTTARNYSTRIAAGELTEDGVRSIMQEQAKGRFGWMASQIDQGVTVADYLAPVRDTIARELEVTSDEINLMDPKWLSLVEVRDEKGEMRAATMNEAMLSARKQSGYAKTRGAQEMATSMMSQIGQIFGRS